MHCQRCNSERVISIGSKCDDRCGIALGDTDVDGYVPYDLGVGGGDYVEFKFCLECGQIQGEFPLPTAAIEEKQETAEEFPQE